MPLTEHTPKQLLPVAGRPFLNYIVDQLSRVPEIDHIIVLSNEQYYPAFEQWAESGPSVKKITVVSNGFKENNLNGAINDLKFALDSENIKDDVFVIGGDKVFTCPIENLMSFYQNKKIATIAVQQGKKERMSSTNEVSINDDGIVTYFKEKPTNPTHDLTAMCFYLLPKDVLGRIDQFLETHDGRHVGDFTEWLYAQETIQAFFFTEPYFNLDTTDDLERANTHFSKELILPKLLK
jgi:glucose-1-phosphate thymidylyltransferase